MTKILVIEDEKAIRMGLEDDLKSEGYEVEFAGDGLEGLSKAQNLGYGLILLDLMLPKMDGLDVCKEIRRKNIHTPIIMLTAKSQDFDKVIGLELGADDYITKPFHSHELRARIKAVLRRSNGQSPAYKPIVNAGPYEMNLSTYQFKKDGISIELTSIEFELFKLLITHPGEVIHRDRILDEVWGDTVVVDSRTVDAHIAKLRRKMGDSKENPSIRCMRGVGYKYVKDFNYD